eukprot:5226438-Pleurochrysis_carterae.AAC.4
MRKEHSQSGERPCGEIRKRARGGERTRGAGERQGPESSTARGLRWCRSVSCAKAAFDAVESRDVGRFGHPPWAQIRRRLLACGRSARALDCKPVRGDDTGVGVRRGRRVERVAAAGRVRRRRAP